MTYCDRERTGNGAFVRRLTEAHTAGSVRLASARHWHPGDVDPGVMSLVGDASHDDYFWFATTAKLFALWHHGRATALRGKAGHGIGHWAHQLGMRDLRAQRLLRRLITASTATDLELALVALAGKRTRHAPHWDTVLDELLGWADPATRAEVRFAWARDFYRYVPARSVVEEPR